MKLPWPRSLFARLSAILLVGILLTIVLSASLFVSERARLGRNAFHAGISEEIAAAVDIVDHLEARERARWLQELSRRRLQLGLAPAGSTLPTDSAAHPLVAALRDKLPAHDFSLQLRPHPRNHHQLLDISVALNDGRLLQIRLPATPPGHLSPLSAGAHGGLQPLSALAALLALIAGVCALTWLAVRMATRPLSEFAAAARALGEDPERAPLPTDGPLEVSQAAAAFNHMQARIHEHMSARTRILAAISHDLQTPITRLRLRAELIDDDSLRSQVQADLDSMQSLIREGLDYARSMESGAAPQELDMDALLAALADDAAATGWTLSLGPPLHCSVKVQSKAFQRALWNLIENGIKFGERVHVSGHCRHGKLLLQIRDHGPGLPPEALETVFEPFFRLESSRNRNTGGTGLGLAIARNLLRQQGGEVQLHNHPEGGLVAELSLPCTSRAQQATAAF